MQRLPPGQKPMKGTLDLTPLPPPNVCIQLLEPVVVHGLLGMKRTTSELHLFVDDPESLVSALTTRAEALRPSGPEASS